MDTELTDHASLIAALGGAAIVADAARTLAVTARAWGARNRIPPEYWPEVIDLAAEKAIQVSAEWLMRTTPARANRTGSPIEAVASEIKQAGVAA